jgi:hypothetical protein
MILLLIALLIYAGYITYLDARRRRLIGALDKAVNLAKTATDENSRNFERIIERLGEISPNEYERDYFFEKTVSGRPRMFTAPVRYIQARRELVISARDALNYERQLAYAYPENTLGSALAATVHAERIETDPALVGTETTKRRFPYGQTETTEVA